MTDDRRALARLITQIENNDPAARPALAALYPRTGRANLVGITGAPGTGKSTLVNELARLYRQAGRTVAVIAVDPTSPFTGGAILGDRIRMRDLAGDPGVFIRSMATRGSLGGLARTTGEVAAALDAAGFDVVLIETVGAGQSEVDIALLAHTVVVVEAPGLGDEVQAIKAGILEIADVLAVNKADQPGAEAVVRALRAMLMLGPSTTRGTSPRSAQDASTALRFAQVYPERSRRSASLEWETPICETVAIEGKGIAELLGAINGHRAYLEKSGRLIERTRERLQHQIELALRETLYANFINQHGRDKINAVVEAVLERKLDVYSAVESIIEGT